MTKTKVKNQYTEKDITLPTKGRKRYNEVKLKGKVEAEEAVTT